MKKEELFWLAGILEGEGSFMKGSPSRPNLPIIQMTITDKDVADRVAVFFNVKSIKASSKRYKDNNWKTPFVAKKVGRGAVLLMKKLYPLMGERRKKQIKEALLCYKNSGYRMEEKDVLKVREMLKEGVTHRIIAKKFGKTRETITRINIGKLHTTT